MQTKYCRGFAITNELVSIEDLRSIAQMQAKMDELVRYRPIEISPDTISHGRLLRRSYSFYMHPHLSYPPRWVFG